MPVYFIQCGMGGAVKIGCTHHLAGRIKTLQTACPYRLELIRTIEGGRETERWLHKRYAEHHRHCEWFDFVPDMLTVQPPTFADDKPVEVLAYMATARVATRRRA